MTALTGLNLETAEDFQVIPSLLVSFPCFSSVAIEKSVLHKLLLKGVERDEGGGGDLIERKLISKIMV